jgi:hypothetical protein
VSPRHFTKLLYGPYFIEDKHYNKVKDSLSEKEKIILFFNKIKKYFIKFKK